MTQYTLIAHKPESSDYCMGCLMSSYSGDMEIAYGSSLDELAALATRCSLANLKLDRGEEGYELTLLIDGFPMLDLLYEPDTSRLALAEEAREWLAGIEATAATNLEEEKRRAERDEAARRRRETAAQKARDRAQYATLHARFGGAHAR
ncbi:hypothetical protein AB4Y45_34740 [Paraburkholderia sp. EG287A]|uniref:hypothetical protein n=1 Tax=Paraburkholderia sp. EG287A TaxID=3237012 RepID=UPI0034D200A1